MFLLGGFRFGDFNCVLSFSWFHYKYAVPSVNSSHCHTFHGMLCCQNTGCLGPIWTTGWVQLLRVYLLALPQPPKIHQNFCGEVKDKTSRNGLTQEFPNFFRWHFFWLSGPFFPMGAMINYIVQECPGVCWNCVSDPSVNT